MLIQCPKCHTSYKVSNNVITTSKPSFRCSRCKHTFVLDLSNELSDAAPSSPEENTKDVIHNEEDPVEGYQKSKELESIHQDFPTVSKDEPTPNQTTRSKISSELEFSISNEEKNKETSVNMEIPPDKDTLTSEEKIGDLFQDIEKSLQKKDIKFQLFSEESGEQEQIPYQSETKEIAEEGQWTLEKKESSAVRVDSDLKETPKSELDHHRFEFPDPGRREEFVAGSSWGTPLSVTPCLSLFVILIFVFTMITVIHQAQPARLESLIRSIPWYGPSIFKNNYLRKGVTFRFLRSGYQKILGKDALTENVFVISGEVINWNPMAVREIQLEGFIYGRKNKEVGRQAISVGNAISSKIIQDMTAREISILQRLKPQNKFSLSPEDSISFAIVFLKPTKNIKFFSCRVLTAQEKI